MPHLNWKDASSYSQGEKKADTPKSWLADAGRFRLIITRVHRYNPERWTLHIYPDLYDTFDMELIDKVPPHIVQTQAEALLGDRLLEALEALKRS